MKSLRRIIFVLMSLIFLENSIGKVKNQIIPEVVLNKLSQRLQGISPSSQDWKDLEAVQKQLNCHSIDCLKSFFAEKIKKYMSEPLYSEKMSYLFQERLGIRPEVEILGKTGNLIYSPESFSINYLISDVFKNNLSWDELYNRKHYSFPTKSFFYGNVSQLYNIPMDQIEIFSQNEGVFNVDLSSNPNISGVFSTERFLKRFWNSGINQGRKRASAFFRILFCDEMFPAIERSIQRKDEMKKAMSDFADHGKLNAQNLSFNIHGSNPACAKCHNRLDPVGWAFRGLSKSISTESFPGELHLIDENGLNIDVEVDSFSDLISKSLETQKYQSCQIKYLQKIFWGNDVSTTEKVQLEIKNQFNKLDRRTNDFIEYLLLRPEFLNGLSVEQNQSDQKIVNEFPQTFKNCNMCHAGEVPYQLDKSTFNSLSLVWKKLDLKNDGKQREMPPAGHFWQPTQDEILNIKNWILQGAPNSFQKDQLKAEEVQKIMENSL